MIDLTLLCWCLLLRHQYFSLVYHHFNPCPDLVLIQASSHHSTGSWLAIANRQIRDNFSYNRQCDACYVLASSMNWTVYSHPPLIETPVWTCSYSLQECVFFHFLEAIIVVWYLLRQALNILLKLFYCWLHYMWFVFMCLFWLNKRLNIIEISERIIFRFTWEVHYRTRQSYSRYIRHHTVTVTFVW